MRTTVNTELFKNSLESAQRVTTKHLTLPILQCVLLEVKKNTLTIKATNLEIGVECTIEAKTDTEGLVAIPAHTLLQTIILNKEKEITLILKENTLSIETKTSKTKIKSVPTDDFPKIPKLEAEGQKINGAVFVEGIRATAFAASQSSIKPELGSVYIFQKKEHTLTFVATDSFRLMEKTVSQKSVVLQNPILIPFKNALEIAYNIDTKGDVLFYTNNNQCSFTIGNIYVTSRLTSGTFPDYEQIIPKEYQTHTTILTTDFSEALKKTNIFLNKFMQLNLAVKKKTITLSSESSEVGTTTEEIPAVTEGEEITLNFNQKYISDAVGYISDESTTLHFAGVGRPLVFDGVHDKSFRYLVMPMNK
jgi:DNA polymerase-3 subunit beta